MRYNITQLRRMLKQQHKTRQRCLKMKRYDLAAICDREMGFIMVFINEVQERGL